MPFEPMLPLHTVVPSWTLANARGEPWTLFKPRGRAHTLLLVAGAGVEVHGYLAECAPHLVELQSLPARGVAVVTSDVPPVVVPPWTMLRDDGRVAGQYLPPGAQVGLFVLDRYNDLYHQWVGDDPHALPPIADVVDWLEAIGRQCSI